VATTLAIETSISLVAGGGAVVEDHLRNTPMARDSPNVQSVRYVTSQATGLQPAGFGLSKDIRQKIQH
jgi:hypothetical protein